MTLPGDSSDSVPEAVRSPLAPGANAPVKPGHPAPTGPLATLGATEQGGVDEATAGSGRVPG